MPSRQGEALAPKPIPKAGKKDLSQRFTVFALVLVGAVVLQILGNVGLVNNYLLHVGSLLGINIILVASLNLVNGYLGEFAIGHAGFMAVGAYVSSIFTVFFHLPFPAALVLGALAAGLIGFLVGIPSFKTFGDYLAIITLGFNMILVNVIQNIDYIGGPRGFGGMPKATNFLTVAVFAVGTLILLRNLIDSNYGRVWVAIRENEIAAEMMGINVMKYKLVAFTTAATLAGVAGALSAHLIQYINPSSFTYIKTTDMLVMLYLGGTASLSGSIIGAAIMTVLMEVLRPFGVFRMVISPLILVAIMLTRPSGLMGNKEFGFLKPLKEVIPHDAPRG